MFRLLIAVIAAVVAATALAEEIPLEKVLAYDMPGTQDIRKLNLPKEVEAPGEPTTSTLIKAIVEALGAQHCPKEGENAGAAFLVTGDGLTALRRVVPVLTNKSSRDEILLANKDSTLVFYAYCGRTPRLDGIERQGNDIVVKYHLHAHRLALSTPHFALIPVGKLSPGVGSVKIERVTDTGPTELMRRLNSEPAGRFVCGSAAFEVAAP